MKHEFRDEDSLESQLEKDEEWQEEDLNWNINLKLTKKQWRLLIKILRKHLKIFMGSLSKLSKVLKKYAMNIDVDSVEIKSQQLYRISIRKWKLIKDAVFKLQDLSIIQESKSKITSPIVVVVQKEKSHFCINLREINSKMR